MYYINNSSCCYSFTLLFLWGFAGSEKVIHTCLLLIKYYKMISIIHQALERRIPNFIHLWWLMIMFSMRCKERSNALSVITCFKLTYITVNSPNTGTHSAGHFWDNFLSLAAAFMCLKTICFRTLYLIYRCDSRLSQRDVIAGFSCQWLLFCYFHLSKLVQISQRNGTIDQKPC